MRERKIIVTQITVSDELAACIIALAERQKNSVKDMIRSIWASLRLISSHQRNDVHCWMMLWFKKSG
jgi:hypothetical protein